MGRAVEVRRAVHGVAPLRSHDSGGAEMRLNRTDATARGKGGPVDEQWAPLNRCVGDEALRRDLVSRDSEAAERRDLGSHLNIAELCSRGL